jgi:hypothetical protein
MSNYLNCTAEFPVPQTSSDWRTKSSPSIYIWNSRKSAIAGMINYMTMTAGDSLRRCQALATPTEEYCSLGCRQKMQGGSIDRADGIKPIANAQLFAVRLKSYVLAATSPPVDRVSPEFIQESGVDGYVKCLVPPSDRPPHMAMTDRRYYRRSIDSFRSMEHFEIEDMFGRRPRPALQIHLTTQPGAPERLWIGIKNEGRAIAKYPGIHCELRDDSISTTDTSFGLQNWSRMNSGRHAIGYAEATHVIHPNGIVAFCGEAAIIRDRAGGSVADLDLLLCRPRRNSKIRLRLGARNDDVV